MIRVVIPAFLAAALIAAVTPARTKAASFDCAKAGTTVEKMVCGDPELSRLDEVLADVYRRVVATAKEADQLRARQPEWLHAIRDT